MTIEAGKQICSPALSCSGVSGGPAGYAAKQAATEGIAMDPDLDPNLQHWQDRFDNLQWVEGSLVALLDSIPT